MSSASRRQAKGFEINRYRVAEGEGAGLVKQHMVGLGQPRQRAAVLDHHTLAQQGARGDDLRGRDRQPQCAGTGDDKHRHRNQQRLVPACSRQQPEDKGEQGETMDRRRIIAGGPVCDPDIEGTALAGLVHQPGDVGDGGVFPGSGDPHGNR